MSAPSQWFSTPEAHYRELWGAAFALIAHEGERHLDQIERTVKDIADEGQR